MEKSTETGLTLLELLCTVLILITIAGMALPSYAHWHQRMQQKLLRDILYHHLLYARSLSLSQGQPVEVCGSRNGLDCNDDWRHGWLIRNADTHTILRTHLLDDATALHWSGFQQTIRFSPAGISPTGNGHFFLCDQPTEQSLWQIIINRQGRVRWSEDNADCS